MPGAFASAVVPAQVAKVWCVVRDFGGLAIWQPAVADCVLSDVQAPDRVGCVRTLSMAGSSSATATRSSPPPSAPSSLATTQPSSRPRRKALGFRTA
ncbi:SRPBCC family protein [Streptomyces sp. RB6PN23]|uniref:SRPBCC family protein n=1 Tax=Streptomyces silvisoli TaxID=3034235 RepID=A0ABT5ZSS7_9ACTN|nr:SRPBCC family protein [Streptomyces silvisoli]